jgi:hypothetical protein
MAQPSRDAVGGLRLLALANTGNGAKAEAKKGKANMAENSKSSVKKESSNTGRTSGLTPERALEILEDSLIKYQKSGGEYAMIPEFFDHGRRCVVAFIYGAKMDDGHLVPLMAQEEKQRAINGTQEQNV